jgi:hypothetical protein
MVTLFKLRLADYRSAAEMIRFKQIVFGVAVFLVLIAIIYWKSDTSDSEVRHSFVQYRIVVDLLASNENSQ